MPQAESYDDLVLGSGAGGKLLAWHLAGSGRRVAVVERRWVGLIPFCLEAGEVMAVVHTAMLAGMPWTGPREPFSPTRRWRKA